MMIKEKGIGRLKLMDEIGKKYGGIFTIYLGSTPKVVVTDYELMKRVLNEDIFTGRPKRFFADLFFRRLGLLYSDGPLWREHRPFAMKTLRDFGLGKPWLAGTIVEEAKDLIRDLEATKQRPTDPAGVITHSSANILCAISYGTRFDHNNRHFQRLALLTSRIIKMAGRNQVLNFFPWLRHIPFLPFKKSYEDYTTNYAKLDAFSESLIEEHKNNFQEGEARDYIDAFLNEQQKQMKASGQTTFTREQLKMSILTLFGAGVETTATTIVWSIVFLVENPDAHRRLVQQVDANIPDGGFPNYENKHLMPYLEAFIMEVLRLSDPIPIPARRTLETTELGGYEIPAETVIYPNLYSAHMDPKFFPNPEKFDPDRFLDANGNIKKLEGYMPFSVGKRYCYGEALAKMELFIFVASLVKYFNFIIPGGETVTSTDSMLALVNAPIPFRVVFQPRSGGRRFSILSTGHRQWDH
ncbi:cytochrome P450 2U1-like [Paramacrobiotus metropolitanus]|uniref:cytochrome P450 2U1-like n=1 Tax=Paramacrobiotus metropolitanus TaxID=2943436 RepID=UPI00244620E6|nr:cytochrome P450 2U1-like [Paramacrobiotus metropolitanus]